MCKLFFVDYENLPDHYDLAALVDMQRGDFLLLYYSENRIDFPVKLIMQLNQWANRGCNIYLDNVDNDFEVTREASYFLALHQSTSNIYIVSDNDKYLTEEARWSGTDKHVYLVSTKSKDKNTRSRRKK